MNGVIETVDHITIYAKTSEEIRMAYDYCEKNHIENPWCTNAVFGNWQEIKFRIDHKEKPFDLESFKPLEEPEKRRFSFIRLLRIIVEFLR